MNKRELEQLRFLPVEIRQLKIQIKQCEKPDKTERGAEWTQASVWKRKGGDAAVPKAPAHDARENPEPPLPEELRSQMKVKVKQLQRQLCQLERWLDSVEDSQMRQILRLRYGEGATWDQVAVRIGGSATYDAVRKKAERFLKKC